MLTREESKVLGYLCHHPIAQMSVVVKNSLPAATSDWSHRIVADLEWLGYITVPYSQFGTPVTIEITRKGLACFDDAPRERATAVPAPAAAS
jgi:hypothetical protein